MVISIGRFLVYTVSTNFDLDDATGTTIVVSLPTLKVLIMRTSPTTTSDRSKNGYINSESLKHIETIGSRSGPRKSSSHPDLYRSRVEVGYGDDEIELVFQDSRKPSLTRSVILARMSITFILSSIYMWWKKVPDFPLGAPSVRGWLMLRAAFGFGGLYCLYYSVHYLTLAEATAFTRKDLIAGLVALIGVVIIAHPPWLFGELKDDLHPKKPTGVDKVSSPQRFLAIAVSILGVVGASGAYTMIRVIGTRAHALMSVNYFSLLATVGSVIALLFVPGVRFQNPQSVLEWVLLVAMGVFGFAFQFLATAGLQLDKTTKATSMLYVQIVIALAFDWGIWGEIPGAWSMFGGTIVICSTLWSALQKPSVKVEKQREADEESPLLGADNTGREETTEVATTCPLGGLPGSIESISLRDLDPYGQLLFSQRWIPSLSQQEITKSFNRSLTSIIVCASPDDASLACFVITGSHIVEYCKSALPGFGKSIGGISTNIAYSYAANSRTLVCRPAVRGATVRALAVYCRTFSISTVRGASVSILTIGGAAVSVPTIYCYTFSIATLLGATDSVLAIDTFSISTVRSDSVSILTISGAAVSVPTIYSCTFSLPSLAISITTIGILTIHSAAIGISTTSISTSITTIYSAAVSIPTVSVSTIRGCAVFSYLFDSTAIRSTSICGTSIRSTSIRGTSICSTSIYSYTIGGSSISSSFFDWPTISSSSISGSPFNWPLIGGSPFNWPLISGSTFDWPTISSSSISGSPFNWPLIGGSTFSSSPFNWPSIGGFAFGQRAVSISAIDRFTVCGHTFCNATTNQLAVCSCAVDQLAISAVSHTPISAEYKSTSIAIPAKSADFTCFTVSASIIGDPHHSSIHCSAALASLLGSLPALPTVAPSLDVPSLTSFVNLPPELAITNVVSKVLAFSSLIAVPTLPSGLLPSISLPTATSLPSGDLPDGPVLLSGILQDDPAAPIAKPNGGPLLSLPLDLPRLPFLSVSDLSAVPSISLPDLSALNSIAPTAILALPSLALPGVTGVPSLRLPVPTSLPAISQLPSIALPSLGAPVSLDVLPTGTLPSLLQAGPSALGLPDTAALPASPLALPSVSVPLQVAPPTAGEILALTSSLPEVGGVPVIPAPSGIIAPLSPSDPDVLPPTPTPRAGVLEEGTILDNSYSYAFLAIGVVRVNSSYLLPRVEQFVGFLPD
ncbi:hypothetical protein ACEQ8H_001884, partial [Pleosporales sp. CAS-2024a]